MGIKANSKKLASKLKKNGNANKSGIRKAAANNLAAKKPMQLNMQKGEAAANSGQIPPKMLAKIKGGR